MNEKLEERVHALVRGECSAAEFLQELPALCDAAPDAAWGALSLIDQYHRRGKLSAEVFETLRQRIERHALGLPDAAIVDEAAAKRVSDWRRPAARRKIASIARHAGVRRQVTEDVRELRLELLGAHTKLQRYRKRISVLAEYGRRTRAALRSAQRDLGAARRQGPEHRKRMNLDDLRRALHARVAVADWNSALRTANWRKALRTARWPDALRKSMASPAPPAAGPVPRLSPRRWSIRPSQIAVVAALLLGVGATRALQELPAYRAPPPTPIPAPPPVPATIVEPGEITLSATRYVVLPGRRSVEIEVQRTGGAEGSVSFRWWTQGSGARPGRDYVSVSSKLARVPDGVDTLHLKVPILRNPSRKHTELFYVAIDKPGGGASLGSIRRATVFIVPP